jgi:cephalosporin hydroxylase
MKLTIDTESKHLLIDSEGKARRLDLYSDEAFELISQQWLKVGWNQKYPYTFTWMGRPIIQLPEDIVRVQEVVFQVKPQVIIETGVAHGGSLILYASLLQAMGIVGRVIGVDVKIRPVNRRAIEAHALAPLISLVEGDSANDGTIARVKKLVPRNRTVLVVLDSCHTKAHVAKELAAYCELVTPGSYLIATDGIMRDLYDVPGGKPEWRDDNPTAAAEEFACTHPEFVLEQPNWLFNESGLRWNLTHWPRAYLRRRNLTKRGDVPASQRRRMFKP